MSVPDAQYKEKTFFLYVIVPLCVLPLFGRVSGCVPSFGEGQSPLSLQAGVGRIWGAVPPVQRLPVFLPLDAFWGTKERAGRKSRGRKRPGSATSARSAGSFTVSGTGL